MQEPLRRASQSCRESAPCCKAVVNVKTETIRSVGECRESRTCVSCGWGVEWTHCCGKQGWVALPQKNLKIERCSNFSSGRVPERLDSKDLRTFLCSENHRGQSRQLHAHMWSVHTLRCHSALEGREVRLTLRSGPALTTLCSVKHSCGRRMRLQGTQKAEKWYIISQMS